MAKNNSDSRRSYDELFENEEDVQTTNILPTQNVAPAAVNSNVASAVETFDRAGDDPADSAHQQRIIRGAPRVLDDITQRLGADIYWSDARFSWALSPNGYKMRFSRRYANPSVLVDIFNNDTRSVREEVSRKRTAIIQHNAEMVRNIEAAGQEYTANYLFFQSRGEVVFGYLPLLLGRFHETDFAEAIAGKVADLPPRHTIPLHEAPGYGARAFR